jgi:hypothetical protein
MINNKPLPVCRLTEEEAAKWGEEEAAGPMHMLLLTVLIASGSRFSSSS